MPDDLKGEEHSEEPHDNEPERLKAKDWENLLKQIKKGKCTPFIGPEACVGVYPAKMERAQRWADSEEYPLEDRSDLARVAQFLAVRDSEAAPIDRLIEEFENVAPPNFADPQEPHRALAELPLPVYITTNYDDFIFRALKNLPLPRDAMRDYCRWRKNAPKTASIFTENYKPTPANPLVFHMYGYTDIPHSLVLTENDYLKFLVNVSRDQDLIPPLVQGAITNASLLFLGYKLDDWDFRILLHTLDNYLENSLAKAHVAVQIVPMGLAATSEQKEKAKKYLDLYFEKLDIRVFWGTCKEFINQLRTRWEMSGYGK